ncbi:MAG: extracellular solute-binding protein [Alphaproteobacteria bacterium]
MGRNTPHDRLLRAGADRRSFQRALAAAGLAVAAVPAWRTPARADAGLAVFGTPARADAGLAVFEWAGYEDPALHPAYTEKYGGEPDYGFFAEEEEALQKLRAGFAADLAHPCTGSVQRWKDAGLLMPIDAARVSGWGDIFPELATIRGVNIDGAPYLMPFDWGNSSIIQRTDIVDQKYIDEPSWTILMDERYKGRVAITDSVDSTYAVAALILGIEKPFAMTDEEIARSSEVVRQIQRNLRFYWNDVTELAQAMASGELVAAYAWNETQVTLSEQSIPVAYVTPKEGILTWVCGLCRIATGKGDEAKAYDYMSALNAPEAGKALIEGYGYGHANTKAFDLVAPERLEALGIKDARTLLAQGIFFDEIPADIREKMINAFDEVKAGG